MHDNSLAGACRQTTGFSHLFKWLVEKRVNMSTFFNNHSLDINDVRLKKPGTAWYFGTTSCLCLRNIPTAFYCLYGQNFSSLYEKFL